MKPTTVDVSKVRACILRFPRGEDAQKAIEIALEEDPDNATKALERPASETADDAYEDESGPVIQRLAVYTSKMWKPGRTLRVLLRGGTPGVRDRVMKSAVVWSEYANIKFEFVTSLPAEIRVGFKEGDGSWSFLGTDANTKPDSENTMNFGWFNDDTDDEEIMGTTLHEFGHALGCVHEHAQPNAKIKWIKERVYEYHRIQDGWTKEEVDEQVFEHYTYEEVSATAHDPLSIMHYHVDKSWTEDGFSAEDNQKLSELDKAFIRKKYPPSPPVRIRTGVVNTYSVRSSTHPTRQENKITVWTHLSSHSKKHVLLGLNLLDINHKAFLRVGAEVESFHKNRMIINLRSFLDTVMVASGCAWLTLPPDDVDLQMGTFSTTEDHPSSRPKKETSRTIAFERPYSRPPTVLVWFNKLSVNNHTNCRVGTSVTNITTHGFKVHISSMLDTTMYVGHVSYLAFSTNRTDICGGTYSTSSVRSTSNPKPKNSAHITFGRQFKKPPQVFMALNKFSMQHGRNVRIRLNASNITNTGMTWHIDSWADTRMYVGGVSYIAVANE